MRIFVFVLSLIAFLSPFINTVFSRICVENKSRYVHRTYAARTSVAQRYTTACGLFYWDRCGRTRYRTQYKSATRREIQYYKGCCSGFTCSLNCDACCTPSCQNGGECNTHNNCACSSGWTGRDCSTDIDECATSNGGCDHECVNDVGSHRCSCHTGYLLASDGRTCEDIDECATDNGGCSNKCYNTMGAHHCYCSNGYTCQDINECDQSNGGCQQNCLNSKGSYRCLCDQGYSLLPDGHRCQSKTR